MKHAFIKPFGRIRIFEVPSMGGACLVGRERSEKLSKEIKEAYHKTMWEASCALTLRSSAPV